MEKNLEKNIHTHTYFLSSLCIYTHTHTHIFSLSMCIYIYIYAWNNPFPVPLKLTQCCKSTILQSKKKKGQRLSKRGRPEGHSAEVGSKCLPRGYRVCQWGAGLAGRQGESSECCSVGRAGAGPRHSWSGCGVGAGSGVRVRRAWGGEGGRSEKKCEGRSGQGGCRSCSEEGPSQRVWIFCFRQWRVKEGLMKDFKLRSNSICYSKIVNSFFFSTNYCLFIDQKNSASTENTKKLEYHLQKWKIIIPSPRKKDKQTVSIWCLPCCSL